jgi:NADH:ubiquinone oxidoreductase subunit 3 (subunit A)
MLSFRSSVQAEESFLPLFVKKITKLVEAGSMDFSLSTYYPIFLYLIAILAFAVGTLVAAHLIGPRKKTPVKLMPYESGMDPIGDAWQRIDVKFYLIAILFLVFDVELLFLYPWAVSAYREGDIALLDDALKGPVFWEVLVFLATLAIGYVYAWRKGVFRWR